MEAGRLSLTRPSDLQHAFWAAQDKTPFASHPHTSPLSAMRLVMLLDSLYMLFSSTFNTLCIGAAIVWYVPTRPAVMCLMSHVLTFERLSYRAYLVLHKPLDELVGLLGCEIPQDPHVDLAGIKADGFVLHWKPADERKSMHRYEIQLNGSIIGQVSHTNTSVVISNLRPSQLYIVRLITVNAVDFRAASSPIRLCTKPQDSHDFFDSPSADNSAAGPVIRPLQIFPETSVVPATPPPLVRETSGGPLQPKKGIFGRRPSPALPGLDTQFTYEDGNEEDGAGDNQQALTEKLDEIGRDTADIDKQIQDEEQEAITAKATLIKERDELRADLKEKDDTSRDLRKQVNALERNNQAVQNKKNAQEKALQQKQNERQKLKDDAARWQEEMAQIQNDMGRIADQKRAVVESTEKEKIELQEKQAQELQALKSMEDENKEVGGQIKKLERDSSDSPSNAEPSEHNDAFAAQEAEEDRFWSEKLRRLEEQYVIAHQNMDAARRFFLEANSQLAVVKQRQTELSQIAASVPPIFEQPMSRASSLRQRRPPSGPAATNPSSASGFTATAGPAFSSGLSTSNPATISPSFTTSAASFFNINNGSMMNDHSFSPAEVEKLTGGAPMSPSAGAELLPAGLLSTADEDPPEHFLGPAAHIHSKREEDGETESRQPSGQMLPGLGVLPGLGALGALPGLGASRPFDQAQAPQSPGSASSRSPSLFASPRASASNLMFNSPDNAMDSDRRSIRSNRSGRAASGSIPTSGSRFGQILGLDKLSRQRGKTLPDESPALGSLSKSQTQSLPRTEEAIEEPSGSSGRRRNSSHSGLFGSVLGKSSAHSKSAGSDSLPSQKHIAVRKRPFNMFGSKTDGWAAILGGDNRPISPRPGSTHSNELPRPSQDSSTWGLWSSAEPFNQRSSPLSSDWMAAPAVTHNMWGSRQPSRRPSVQHGQSGTFDILEDDHNSSFALSPSYTAASLAPIGTKPAHMLQRIPEPKLNPAAKDFKSLFSRARRANGENVSSDEDDDEEETEHLGITPIGSPSNHKPTLLTPSSPDTSPELSRRSRDTHSLHTSSSINESRSSLDRSTSYTPSETPHSVSGSSNKESFMAKLTRKSSSGKFALPVFGREKKKRESNGGLLLDEDEEVENLASSMELEKGREKEKGKEKEREKEGSARAGSVRSWSSVFAMGKKKSGISGASIASETGDETDDGVVEGK